MPPSDMDVPRSPLAVAVAVAGLLGAVEPGALAAPMGPQPRMHPAAPPPPRAFETARVIRGAVSLRAAPGARVVGRAAPRTEFGSPTELSVAARRGRWLGVKTAAVRGLAWIDGHSRELARARTRVSVH